MSDTLTLDAPTLIVAARADGSLTERRRPGRMQNPNPALIALMRKPTRTAQLKVALYDAPNFIPAERIASPVPTPSTLRAWLALLVSALSPGPAPSLPWLRSGASLLPVHRWLLTCVIAGG